MTEKNNINEDTSDREMVFTRIFDAPRELVFKAWTDPKLIEKWW
ncbi:MAG: SRPBCC domain-containing protein, partial [Thaumarchaeota archaeon]|nr:SRPBCC domain-containing protein [Nitrososphaerota archaeon]